MAATASAWGALAQTLRPAGCGVCHPAQHADWKGSRHAQAMSAGLRAQLLGDNRCYAPLAEQRPVVRDRAVGAQYRDDLRAAGLICASCHVRHGKVLGPPLRSSTPSATAVAPAGGLPHGGCIANEAFSDSRFCANCHQFAPGIGVIAGLPLGDTYAEWQDTTFARQGISCQGCHMPDRRHLWRGIYDPEMTASGPEVELTRSAGREVRFTATSVRVGHKIFDLRNAADLVGDGRP